MRRKVTPCAASHPSELTEVGAVALKVYEVEHNGTRLTMQFHEGEQPEGAVEAKAREPQNKARTPRNKKP